MTADLKDLPTVIACAGPPTCLLEGDEAVANSEAGCPLCEHIALHSDGSETRYRLPRH